jgi:drug/metabolite transporter (DMT)-like permease
MLGGAFLLITNGAMIVPCSGDVLIIFVAMIIAFQNVLAKKIMRTASSDMVILCRACLSSLIIVIFVPLAFGIQGKVIVFNGFFYPTITGVLYFFSVLCHYNAIKLIGPFITTAFFLSGSLFSALFAYILLGETLSLIQWLGVGGILLGGFYIIKKPRIGKNDG